MKQIPGYALAILALGLTACVALQGGQPATIPGAGPGGREMTTATQQAVGQNFARDTPVYPLLLDLSGSNATAAADSAEAYRWLEALDTPAVKQFIEAQNKVSSPRLAALPLRARFHERVAQIAAARQLLPPELQLGRAGPAGLIARPTAGGYWEIVRPDGQVQEKVSATSVVWAPVAAGQGAVLYYSRQGQGSQRPGVYQHRLGDNPQLDARIYAPADAALVPLVDITPDGQHLVITLTDGPDRSGVQLIDLHQAPPRAITLFSVGDAVYRYIGASPERLYFQTNRNAPLGRIIAVSAREPLTASSGVVPESAGRLEHAAFIGNRVITSTVEDGRSVVRLFTPDGKPAGEVALPGDGRVEGFGGRTEAFFTYTDYVTPPTAYRLDLTTGQARPWSTAQPAVSTSAYATERLIVPGQEGSRVMLYVTRARDRPRDGDQPLILQASAQLTPAFSPEVLAWLELGGAYAEVSVLPERRVGLVRENSVDKIQAAAQFLVRQRYTRTRRLGIYGRGSSALAAAAALTAHPEQYGAAVAGLTADPGDDTRPAIETNAAFRRVRKGLCYPPTLVSTLDHDTQVPPADGYQLIAHLQAVQLCGNPVLLRVDPRPGTPEEVSADHWAFMAQWLGIGMPTS